MAQGYKRPPRLNIFTYSDFRLFIKDWHALQKRYRTGSTYRSIASFTGLSSPGYITLLFNKKVRLNEAAIGKFADLMGLTQNESRFFRDLVHYNQAKTYEDKKGSLNQLVKSGRKSAAVLDPDQLEYYQKWYYSVVHDVLSFYPFDGDFGNLGKMLDPPISKGAARRSVRLLEKLGFIEKTDSNTFRCLYPSISASSPEKHIALNTYAQAMIDKAKNALAEKEQNERLISWAGFSMSEKTYEIVLDEARAFRRRIVELAREDKGPDRAYHLNLQIFPVSQSYRPPAKTTDEEKSLNE
jgi:uncharacterized protein (TIGR02147 family)